MSDAEIEAETAKNMPDLNRVSDVVALQYIELARLNGHDPKQIKHLIWHSIETPYANQVIDHILQSKGYKKVSKPHKGTYEAPPWGKHLTLKPNTDDFYALVGIPNGAANAFMLFQHKQQLGPSKRIGRIFITLDSVQQPGSKVNYNGPTVVFELEDAAGEGSSAVGGPAPGSKHARPADDNGGGNGKPGLSKHKPHGGGSGKGGGSASGSGSGKGKGKSNAKL